MRNIQTYEGFLSKVKKFMTKKKKCSLTSNEVITIVEEAFLEMEDVGFSIEVYEGDSSGNKIYGYNYADDIPYSEYVNVMVDKSVSNSIRSERFDITSELVECFKFIIPYLKEEGIEFEKFVILYYPYSDVTKKSRFDTTDSDSFIDILEKEVLPRPSTRAIRSEPGSAYVTEENFARVELIKLFIKL